MNRYFLPKEFDAEKDYCSEYQYGKNTTHPHWHSGAEIIYVTAGEADVMREMWHGSPCGSFVPETTRRRVIVSHSNPL